MYEYKWEGACKWEYVCECKNENVSRGVRDKPKVRNLKCETQCLHQIQWQRYVSVNKMCICGYECEWEYVCMKIWMKIYICEFEKLWMRICVSGYKWEYEWECVCKNANANICMRM